MTSDGSNDHADRTDFKLAFFTSLSIYEGVLISFQPDQEGNKLQLPNLGFIQHALHEAQQISQPVAVTLQATKKKNAERGTSQVENHQVLTGPPSF